MMYQGFTDQNRALTFTEERVINLSGSHFSSRRKPRVRPLVCECLEAPWLASGAKSWVSVVLSVLSTLIGASAITAAGPALLDNLNRSELALTLANQTDKVELLDHGFETARSRWGGQAERVVLNCRAGETARLVYQSPKAPVINELRLTVWTMSSRPGVRLAARVVLPRSENPKTGVPFEMTVRGSRSTSVGAWQEIGLRNFPQLVAMQARVARVQHHVPIDERGAYVDQVLLIVPGGPGPVEVLLDRVEIKGVLQPAKNSPNVLQTLATANVAANVAGPPNARALSQSSAEANSHRTPPLVPRIIQWQGESFRYLARMGFDTVAMNRMATARELADAGRSGLSLFCPPPSPRELTAMGLASKPGPNALASGKSANVVSKLPEASVSKSPEASAFGSHHVMAWNLGKLAMEADIETAARWQELLERYDSVANRRSVIVPGRFPREASRIANVMLLGRNTLGSSLSLRDYATWLTQQRRQYRPGILVWSRIETEMNPAHAAQLASQGPAGQLASVISAQQLSAQIALASTIKSQGFYFTSHTSLESNDPATRRRALTLELANLQLGLLEPWLASGKLIASARSNDPQTTAAVLQVERSYLIVPMRWRAAEQSIETSRAEINRAGESYSFVVPGIPESSEVYYLSLAGTDRLRHRRVTGGVRIFLDSHDLNGLILITDDGNAFSQVASYLKKQGPRAVKLERDLAAVRLQQLSQIVHKQPASGRSQTERLLEASAGQIRQCDRQLSQRNLQVAHRFATGANSTLDRLDESLRKPTPNEALLATAPSVSSPESPAIVQRHWVTDFEKLEKLMQAGWRHQRMPTAGVATAVRLSPVAPHQGAYCLEMEAKGEKKNGAESMAPLVIATAPVWVTSAPVRIRAGERVEISGMVRVPKPILGTVDGLQIFDSLGGKSLALRFQQTPSWKPFRIVRTAPIETDLRVTFALTGLGTAQLDDVAIRTKEKEPQRTQ